MSDQCIRYRDHHHIRHIEATSYTIILCENCGFCKKFSYTTDDDVDQVNNCKRNNLCVERNVFHKKYI